MEWRYLTGEEILVVHALVVDETGGMHGVRDVGLLSAATARPQAALGGAELFPGVFEKAAAYLDSIARHHLFIDGNKRTAIAVAARFLHLHGYNLIASQKEAVAFVLKVATQKLETVEIAGWLRAHSSRRMP